MIRRIAELAVAGPLTLSVRFDDGKSVLYDVSEDVAAIPSYEPLATVPGLFEAVQLDQSRTCVWWNADIDLPSDAIYGYGRPIAV